MRKRRAPRRKTRIEIEFNADVPREIPFEKGYFIWVLDGWLWFHAGVPRLIIEGQNATAN
jgi:hypothetical protein